MKNYTFAISPRALGICLALIAAWGLLFDARADGKVFPTSAHAPVDIPDQRALIHYAEGVQTLVVETSFNGEGHEFAWVVPLPAQPRIEAVSAGVFRTLEYQFQPRVVLSVIRWWIGIAAVGVLAVVGILAVCQKVYSPAVVLAVAAAALILAGFLAPALSKAGAGLEASAAGAVPINILDRQRAGIFETTTVSSPEPEALVEWLRENGFAVETSVEPVVADYVRAGWVFVAARIAREEEGAGLGAIHPLAFTFKTEKPVYPLRLTGVGNGPCRIDLYVFGPGRARAPGFAVKRCERPLYSVMEENPRFRSERLRILHQELAGLVQGARVATKLSGELDARDMEKDAFISWRRYRPTKPVLYTTEAAAHASGNVAAILALLGCGGLVLAGRRFGWDRATLIRCSTVLTCASMAIAGLFFVSAWKTERDSLHLISAPELRGSSFTRSLALDLRLVLKHELSQFPDQAVSSGKARELLEEILAYDSRSRRGRNVFSGQTIRIEASPGNYTLREIPAGFELVWHDADGAEAVISKVALPEKLPQELPD